MKPVDIQKEILRALDSKDAQAGGSIVVWHDPEEEFAQTLEQLELPGVEVIREQQNHEFELKRRLNEDLSGRRILLYRPRGRNLDGDWLADVEMRAKSFSADYASIQLREIGAQDTPELRRALADHKRFFAKKRNIKALAQLCPSFDAPGKLELAMTAVIVGAKELDPAKILLAWILDLHNSKGEAVKKELEDAQLLEGFSTVVSTWCGYESELDNKALLCQHVLLSCMAPQLSTSALASLSPCFSSTGAPFCNSVFEAWGRDKDDAGHEALYAECMALEDYNDLPTKFEGAPLDALMECQALPCVDAAILRQLIAKIKDPHADGSEPLARAAARRNRFWYPRFEVYYQAVCAAAHMEQFYQDHNGTIEFGTAPELWEAYTKSYYRMDRWYREFNTALSAARKNSLYGLDDDLREASETVENLYKNWFLRELSQRWYAACEDGLRENGYAPDVDRQLAFDMSVVGPMARSTKRAWIIISDALRYEVAQELCERIERTTRCVGSLKAVQSVFPSITKCGMAALLPASTYEIAEDVNEARVLADDARCASTEERQAILGAHYPGAVAVTYTRFINEMNQSERKELVADAPVVYIYHNTIDAEGDKTVTEHKAFDACREAVEELTSLVNRLVREQRASSIAITADHGFLYTVHPLEESESASLANVEGDVVESGRRYVLARNGATSPAFAPVRVMSSSLTGFAPRECVRIKKAGGGSNFVHGGFTLQECCVPVLCCTAKRKGAQGYTESAPVGVSVITELDTVTNGMFGLDVLQEEPVSGSATPATYELFVGDAAQNPITNICTVVADRDDTDARARTTHLDFAIRPGADPDSSAAYALWARNTSSQEVEKLRDLKVSLAFAPLDFGW